MDSKLSFSKMVEEVDTILRPLVHSNNLTARSTSDGIESAQLTHFHRFPDLPTELRQMIYQACLPRRVFRFTYETLPTPVKSEMNFADKPSGLPHIASVCKDAYDYCKLFVREYRVDYTEIISVEREQYFYKTTRIRFDPDLDTFLINYSGTTPDCDAAADHRIHETHLESLPDGPYALAMKPNVNVVLDIENLVGPRYIDSLWMIRCLTARPYSDCLTQHSHCTVMLATTKLTTTSLEIRSSGLFGMFGEERNILIDINDTAKIDQYENFVDQVESRDGSSFSCASNYFPEDVRADNSLRDIGAGRYGTYYGAGEGTITDDWHTRDDDGKTPPTVFSRIAEKDTANALSLIKQSWLEAHDCFEPPEEPLVPWTGDERHRQWDDEHHVAKHWLRKLPTFSFVAMYIVTDNR